MSFKFWGKQPTAIDYESTYGLINDYENEAVFIGQIAASLNLLPKTSILDVGCGTGRLLSEVQRCGKNFLVTGVDSSAHFIEFAKQRNIAQSTFINGKCQSEKFPPNSFDVIVYSTFLLQTEASSSDALEMINNSLTWLSGPGIIIFSFINERKYRSIYCDGNFEIPLKNSLWNGTGNTSFDKDVNKRRLRLEFHSLATGERFGSEAEYLNWDIESLSELFGDQFNLRFITGKECGMTPSETRYWCVLSRK